MGVDFKVSLLEINTDERCPSHSSLMLVFGGKRKKKCQLTDKNQHNCQMIKISRLQQPENVSAY